MIEENLRVIRKKIENAAQRANRDPREIRIVGAAKKQPTTRVRDAIAAGLTILGHNYVQEAAEEKAGLDVQGIEFHMIGHLQKNKAGKAVELFDTIQSVDSIALGQALDRRAQAAGRITGVMIQVNLGHEPQKSGIHERAVEELVTAIRQLPNLRLTGFMTMPPFFDDPEGARPYFAALRQLRDSLTSSGCLTPDMAELSMGMTGDFEVAVEEGATLVRIGTALFGPR